MCNCQPNKKEWIVPDFITVDMGDVCIECERDTSFGSGYFVNRLPADRMVEDDDELCKIWNIIEIAMEREGYDVQNAELSMRLYDQELESNIEYDS